MTFDTRTSGVDVNWYARTLRRSIHAGEISTVTFRIVAPKRVSVLCGKTRSPATSATEAARA